ncbi:MAG TPA: NACHT domain-containing protein [Thermoanaerobaculia bacterium]
MTCSAAARCRCSTPTASLVLGLEDYRQAYREGPYLQLCEKLWSEGRLVVVGCGFSDPWLGLIADRAITDSGARPVTAPGHVALVGLPVEKLETVGVERDRLEDRYHTGVLFYPVERRDDGVEDHGALLELLGELEERTAAPRTEPSPGSPRAPRRAGGDARTAWLAQVAEEHRRLTDHFERPVELQDLETAWVRLELALPEAAGARLPEVAKEGELMAGRRSLEEFLALDPKKQRWVTRRWLVEGDPGSGKTTLLRHLAGRLARGSGSGPIPVFISLPRLVEPPRLPQTYLADEYGDFCGPGLSDTIDVAGREGRLLLLLDGLG